MTRRPLDLVLDTLTLVSWLLGLFALGYFLVIVVVLPVVAYLLG